MKRRRLLIGLGSLCVGGGTAVGSGAFTSTRARRKVNIEVADDEDAYLGMNAISGLGRTAEFDNPEKIVFSIPGIEEDTPGDTIGQGLGPNSKYTFSDLVEITNHGDDSVTVWSKPGRLNPGIDYLSLVNNSKDAGLIDEKEKGVLLSPGEEFIAGLFIDTGNDIGAFDVSITIMAEQDSSTESIPGGTSQRFEIGDARVTGPTSSDKSGVRFDLVNGYDQEAKITEISITPEDGDIDLVSDQIGGTNYTDFTFNADVHIEAYQDGYVDAGSDKFKLPNTIDLSSDGWSDEADQVAILAPKESAVVNLYSFRDNNGNKLDMKNRRLDLSFSIVFEDGTTDRINTSITA